MLKLTILLSFFIYPLLIWAEQKALIKDIRYYEISSGVRVVIESTNYVEFTKGQLKNPDRVFFDIKNAVLNKDIKKEIFLNTQEVFRIRIGQFDPNTVRFVFDLNSSHYNLKVITLEDPFRLVIDVYSQQSSRIYEQKEKSLLKRKIVIDPGHGGKDPGAIGPTGLQEKEIVLDIALKIKEFFKSDPSYDIILTRDKDMYVSLEERAEIANKAEADLFISIHTNASPNIYSKGIETYLLNWTDDEEAIRVAARENAISVNKMRQLKGELGVVLASLEREAKRDESIKLASYIHTSIVESLKKSFLRSDNGVKQALFYVLIGAKMPSVLLEISYISNPEEEYLLSQDFYRTKIAQAIAEGIINYFSKSDRIKKVKYTKNKVIKVKKSNGYINKKRTHL
ncbi:MAG: N-acetylmuramoyl-L-alanine amidase [Thermodesulfovibrio sp.]|nr:N-acetylmuramoyl-L-alanine amidase [Thermodesulfovibrio sp.]